jgi:hypothetical protein
LSRAEGQRADEADQRQRRQTAVHGDAEHRPGEGDQHHDFGGEERQPAEQQRQQIVGSRHRRGHQALEQLAGARRDDGEAGAPHPGAHDVHAEQAGHQPVDVARADGTHGVLAGGERVGPPRRLLQRRIDREARDLAFGARRIEAVGRRVAGHDRDLYPSVPQRPIDAAGIELADHEPAGPLEGRRQYRRPSAGFDADDHRLVGATAKCHTERAGHDHRKREYPEHRLWFAQELAHSHQRQLAQRVEPLLVVRDPGDHCRLRRR